MVDRIIFIGTAEKGNGYATCAQKDMRLSDTGHEGQEDKGEEFQFVELLPKYSVSTQALLTRRKVVGNLWMERDLHASEGFSERAYLYVCMWAGLPKLEFLSGQAYYGTEGKCLSGIVGHSTMLCSRPFPLRRSDSKNAVHRLLICAAGRITTDPTTISKTPLELFFMFFSNNDEFSSGLNVFPIIFRRSSALMMVMNTSTRIRMYGRVKKK